MYQNLFIEDDRAGGPTIVHLWDDKKGYKKGPYKKFRYAFVKDPEGPLTSIYGERLKKITRYRKTDLGLYESDVPRETRVLVDRYLNSDIPSVGHKVLIFDIEVSSIGGFAHPSTAEKEITAIANYCEGRYTVFILDPDARIPSSQTDDVDIISVPTEKKLLKMWLQYYTALAPTIISGWNTDTYDIPYLYNRLCNLFGRAAASWLSPIRIVRYNENREKYVIAGVSALDYIKLYKEFTYIQQPSYRLDAIGRLEVGMGKVEYLHTLDELYKTDIQTFVEYNLTDVRIVAALDKKLRLIELARFICHTGHVPYEDYQYSSRFIEGTILTYLHRKNIICPNKPLGGREKFEAMKASRKKGISGAFVKEPVPGLYNWVYSLDLQSLYPSIIMSLNISPETKVGKVLNWDTQAHVDGTKTDYEVQDHDATIVQTMGRAEFLKLIEGIGCTISSQGILYDKKKTGVIPEILSNWFDQRLEYKKKMKEFKKAGNQEEADFYDKRQHVQKILLNSIYGCLALPIFRFHDSDNGESVTKSGQAIIKSTAKFINNQYPQTDIDNCIYSDTDSVYFSSLPISYPTYTTKSDLFTSAIEVAKGTERSVNRYYQQMAKDLFNCDSHRFLIKGEKVIETGLWLAKKRYALKQVYDLDADMDVDEITYKGLDIVRSTFPPAFKKLMEDVIKAVLYKSDKAYVDLLLTNFYTELSNKGHLELARNTSIKLNKYRPKIEGWNMYEKGTPIAVKAAIAYNRTLRFFRQDVKYEPLGNSQKIKWVYLKPNPLGLDFIACNGYDDPPEVINLIQQYIDYDQLVEGELIKKLEHVYTAMGWGELPIATGTSKQAVFAIT